MTQIHKGYALALFSLSVEKNNTELVFQQLQDAYTVFSSNREYLDLLSSFSLSKNERKNLLTQAISKKYCQDVTAFLLILCEKGIIAKPNDKKFRPADNITREEFTKMMVVALYSGATADDHKFTDETDGAWYNYYLDFV
jgi:hypothetical protein